MSSERDHSADVAVVGIAAQLPSGSYSDSNLDYRSFFQFLLDHGEAYETIPIERFNVHTLKGNGLGQVATDTGTFLKDVHLFDPLEFGVSNKDARMMPLSTRKLIETAFLSLVDAGIDYRGKNVGCYMAGVAFDMFSISGHDDDEARGSFTAGPGMVATRVSYHLDLRGPSIPVDTACSSSLTATHLAVQAIVHGECDAAVVGGAQINHRFTEWLAYSQGGVLAPDGKCKPFDASADGFGRGEGVVCMVLKPLEAALRDGDKVYATILGTGINNCGSLGPANAPVASSQREAMERAFAQAHRQPQEVDFLELHATGTAMGDPTEANWVGERFKRGDELIVGSLKGNVGHLEITAFLASLCKVCGMFETGTIPPNVNFLTPNPAIRWQEYKFRVPVQAEELRVRSSSGRALVAMTSSGIGGANGHCVVESHPPVSPRQQSFWRAGYEPAALLIAGGLSPRSCGTVGEAISEGLSSWMADAQRAAARTYGRRARSMTWKSFAIKDERGLTKFSEPLLGPRTAPPVVFVFSGQGTQHYAMGRELFAASAVFRDSVLHLDQIYKSATGWSLVERTGMFDGARSSDPLGEIWPIAITLPALTILQIALVDTLAALGIKSDVVVGHSAGETPLLYASGAGSRALAVELAIARGKAMSLLESQQGTMAALSCSPERAAEIISEVLTELGPGSLEIGCYNSPGGVTLSGKDTYIDLAVKKASDAGIFARRLRTRIPVHSAMMDVCKDEYRRLIDDVFARHAVSGTMVETYSTATGELFGSSFDAQYFWDNTHGPVMFTDAIQAIAAKYPNATYVEIGPHPALTSYVASMAKKTTTVVCPLRRPKSTEKQAVEVASFLECLGKLFVAGHTSVDFDALYGTALPPPEAIAPYPFAQKDIPWTIPTAEIARQRQHRNGPLNYPQLQLNEKTHPGLADHVIKGQPILSTAGYIEMALEFGARKLYNVELISILSLSAKRPTPVDVRLDGTRWSVLSAPPVDFTKTWPIQYTRLHAKGHLSMEADPRDARPVRSPRDIAADFQPVEMKGFYEGIRTFAEYGPTYRRLLECKRGVDPRTGVDQLLVKLRGADTDLPDIADYRIHPAILDSALHILFHPLVTGIIDTSRYYLPSRMGALIVHDALIGRPFPSIVYSHGTFRAYTPDTLVYDFVVMTEDGTPLFSVDEFEVSLHGKTVPQLEKRYEVVYQKADILLESPQPVTSGPSSSNGSSPGRATPDSGYHTALDSGHRPDVAHNLKDATQSTRSRPSIILSYCRGKELDIQQEIKKLDPLAEVSLWFHTVAGTNGHGLAGFSRALRKEHLAWSIHAVVFDASWNDARITKAMEALTTGREDVEEELEVDAHGGVTVPRIVETSSPAMRAAFKPELPWKYEKSILKQVSAPYVPPEHTRIVLCGAVVATEQLWSFVGRASSSSSAVIGIASGPLSNAVVVPESAVAELPQPSSIEAVPCALAGAIAVLAVGHTLFSRPAHLQRKTILVTHSDTDIGSAIARIYRAIGATVLVLPAGYTAADLKEVYLHNPQIIVSGSQDGAEIRTFKDIVSRSGSLFLWDGPDNDVSRVLETDPWLVGEALRLAMPYRREFEQRHLAPLELLPCAFPMEVSLDTDLLDPAKSYVLVGGIGSLGLQIAYWMYGHGAQELLLTSRSGRAGLVRRGDFAAVRLYDYLQSLPDLRMRVALFGGNDVRQMKEHLKELHRPVGGCMILSGVAVDLPFVSQTAESFEAPFPAKVGAFELVEQSLAIEGLDFLVTFSSVSGMFGNAGQTNYASANTSIAGLTRKYRNAVCMVAPALLDTYTIQKDIIASPNGGLRLRHVTRWAMTCAELLPHLEDAIRKLRDGPVWQYIPAFNWGLVKECMGPSSLYNDLVPDESAVDADSLGSTSTTSVKDVVCKVLDVAHEDLSSDVPFTSYGLDSISAGALSFALRPFLTISQIQLLADLTLKELEARLGSSDNVS